MKLYQLSDEDMTAQANVVKHLVLNHLAKNNLFAEDTDVEHLHKTLGVVYAKRSLFNRIFGKNIGPPPDESRYLIIEIKE